MFPSPVLFPECDVFGSYTPDDDQEPVDGCLTQRLWEDGSAMSSILSDALLELDHMPMKTSLSSLSSHISTQARQYPCYDEMHHSFAYTNASMTGSSCASLCISSASLYRITNLISSRAVEYAWLFVTFACRQRYCVRTE